MTPRLTEKQFMAQVVQLARLLGWMVFHPYDSRRSEPGFPDLVLCKPGVGVLYRELKTDVGKVTDEQQRWLSALVIAGADARVWRPMDWALIERTLRGE